MGKRTSIRLYKSGDAKGINEMFTKHTPYLRDDAYWTWINRIVGQSISVVAECDDRIIGHYAVVPRNLIVKNRVLKAALGIHAFVDPDFRREISIFEISNYLYRIAQDKGIQVIYGFPNVNYRQIQVRIERWKEVALFKSYEPPSDKGLDNIKTTIQFDEIKDIDYEHLFRLSEMLASESVMNEVRLETNTNYWISRYMLNPQTPYLLYALSKCGVPIGYMVTKRYKNNGNCYSHIVDYILSDNSYMDDVISSYLNNEKAECDYFSFWKGDSVFERSIEKSGFVETGFETFLAIKLLDKSLSELDVLLDFDNWRLVMGDSDAF